jgi:hypothetical protein
MELTRCALAMTLLPSASIRGSCNPQSAVCALAASSGELPRARLGQDRLVLRPQVRDLLVGRGLDEQRHHLLETQPELVGVADEMEIDVRDLQAALQHGPDQAPDLEPRDELADRIQEHAGELGEPALRDELARLQVAGEQMPREPAIGLLAQVDRDSIFGMKRHLIATRHVSA